MIVTSTLGRAQHSHTGTSVAFVCFLSPRRCCSQDFLEALEDAQEDGWLPQVAVLCMYRRNYRSRNQGSRFDLNNGASKQDDYFDRSKPRVSLAPLSAHAQKRLLQVMCYGREAEEQSRAHNGSRRLPPPPKHLLQVAAELSGGNPMLLHTLANFWLENHIVEAPRQYSPCLLYTSPSPRDRG